MKYLIVIFLFSLTFIHTSYSQLEKNIPIQNLDIICDINDVRYKAGKWPLVIPYRIKDSVFYAHYVVKDSIVVNKKEIIEKLYKTNIYKMHDGSIEVLTLNKKQVLIKIYD